jgi:hypothetical protein
VRSRPSGGCLDVGCHTTEVSIGVRVLYRQLVTPSIDPVSHEQRFISIQSRCSFGSVIPVSELWEGDATDSSLIYIRLS